MIWRWLIIFSLVLAAPRLAPAQGGTITGQVEITNSREAAVRRNKDYSGVVLWLDPLNGSAPPAAAKHVQMKQEGKRFIPHVLAISVGSTVDFPNLDPIFHNAFSNFSGQPFDVGLYPPNTSKSQVFRKPGIVRVFCNIHSQMSAIIAVLNTPWYAVTNSAGKFTIAGVPPGQYQLHIFHERSLPDVLKFLEHPITVPDSALTLPLISISETGYIPAPHTNKYGKDYPPAPSDSTYPGGHK